MALRRARTLSGLQSLSCPPLPVGTEPGSKGPGLFQHRGLCTVPHQTQELVPWYPDTLRADRLQPVEACHLSSQMGTE